MQFTDERLQATIADTFTMQHASNDTLFLTCLHACLHNGLGQVARSHLFDSGAGPTHYVHQITAANKSKTFTAATAVTQHQHHHVTH
jgi:hypothetical protein